jgi:hypothetical protein
VVVLLAATLLVAGFLVWCGSGRVSRANYNRIRIGMTQPEVEAILGGPGREIGPLGWEDVHVVEDIQVILSAPPPQSNRFWAIETRLIDVVFDGQGRVVAKYYQRHPEKVRGIQRLVDWLGL